MKWVSVAVAFILTACLIIVGVTLYPDILGRAATQNNDYIFAFFIGPLFVLLLFAWVGEKLVLRILKKS